MAGPSQGLAADARALVLTEDVVCWADGRGGSGTAFGLVSRVAGQSDDEALSDSEDEEARARPRRARRRLRARRAVRRDVTTDGTFAAQALPPGHCNVVWLTEPLPEEGDDDTEAVPTEALRIQDRGAFAALRPSHAALGPCVTRLGL